MLKNRFEDLKAVWKEEEARAHIHGWDFSHIAGRYDEENDLPWDYRGIIKDYLKDSDELPDCSRKTDLIFVKLRDRYRHGEEKKHVKCTY